MKKVISLAAAAALVFGTAAYLPAGVVTAPTALTARADTYGDYEYEALDDGTLEITKYNGSDKELSIPSSIDEKKVTSIGEFAFYSCTSLTSITISQPNKKTVTR